MRVKSGEQVEDLMGRDPEREGGMSLGKTRKAHGGGAEKRGGEFGRKSERRGRSDNDKGLGGETPHLLIPTRLKRF